MKELFLNFLIVSFSTSFFILFWLLVRKLINQRYSYRINHFVWMAISVRLICCTALTIPLFSRILEITPHEKELSYEISQSLQNTTSILQPNTIISIKDLTEAQIAVPNMFIYSLIIIWLTGFLLCLLIKVIGYFLLCNKVKHGEIANSYTYFIFQRCSEKLQNKYNINIVILNNIASPLILGFFRKLIVLPRLDYTELELEYILTHEIIHAMRKDIWYKFACVFASCIHWFNPLSYVLVKQCEKDMEYYCDLEVVKERNMHYRKNYCKSILKLMEIRQKSDKIDFGFVLTNNFNHNKKTIKARMENILNMKKKKNSRLIIVIIIAVLLVSTSFLVFSGKNNVSIFESLLYGDVSSLVTDPLKYGEFEHFNGYSSLDIFPQNISSSMIEDYHYSYQDTLFDPTSQIYLSCSYDTETYEAEIGRLSKIEKSYKGRTQRVIYDTDNYNYPAYVTIDANNHCYEYALLIGDNKIVYIFLQFIKLNDIAFNLEYLPEKYENTVTDKKKGYSIYMFYKDNGDGISVY